LSVFCGGEVFVVAVVFVLLLGVVVVVVVVVVGACIQQTKSTPTELHARRSDNKYRYKYVIPAAYHC